MRVFTHQVVVTLLAKTIFSTANRTWAIDNHHLEILGWIPLVFSFPLFREEHHVSLTSSRFYVD
jgi:hypothetical protein